MNVKNLSNEDIEFIKELQSSLKTDDPRCTSDPIFVVQEKYKSTTFSGYGEEVEYIEDITGEHTTYNDLDILKKELIEDGYNEKDIDYIEHFYVYKWKDVNHFFSQKGAQRFIDRYNHNYEPLRIYVKSLYFCEEMKKLRNILLKIEFNDE